MKLNVDYLLMQKDELIKYGIKGNRLTIALLLKSTIYDIMMIILILIYTALIFLYFSLDDTTFGNVH